MSDYLMRNDAPLTEGEWKRLDELVVSAARRVLVGRRFIDLTGPLGIGTQIVPLDSIGSMEACLHEDAGCACKDGECDAVQITGRQYVPLALIHQDFLLSWRDVEAAHQSGAGLEMGPAAAAAVSVARTEDKMVLQGLLEAGASQALSLSDWAEAGNALEDVVKATQSLADASCYAPYALIVSPALYGLLQRPYRNSGRLEIKLVKSIVDGGVFQSPTLTAKQALVISQGRHHLDLAIGQDMITAYLGPEGMDHRFRALESLALRIKQPGAICVLK